MSAQPVASFDGFTRLKRTQAPDIARPVGGGLSVPYYLPRAGLLARVYACIRGAVSGTLTVPNAFGMASIVRQIRLTLNSGFDVVNLSGQGYHYLLRQLQELKQDTTPQSTARNAVTATTYILDMVLPIMLNLRDAIGLIMLQSEQTVGTILIDWLADATVATGATVTGTATFYLETFSVPGDDKNWPPLNVLHRVMETNEAVPSAADYPYNWPRGNRYLQLAHGLGMGTAGADGWTKVILRASQSDNFEQLDPKGQDVTHNYRSFQQRLLGTILFDLMSYSGQGVYDKMRDTVDSRRVTDLQSVITPTGAGTLYTVRRELVRAG